MTSAQEWISLAKELKQTHAERNLDYWKLHNIYHGNYYENMRRDVHDGAGRLILRDNRGRMNERKPLVANLLKGVVDDYVSLIGQLPDIKVPPPGTSDTDQKFADKLEHFHYGTWHASAMLMQLKAMGWWNSVMGGCAAVVWPNFIRKHAVIRFVAPYMVYGVPDLVEPFELSKAIICEKFDYLSIKDYYPGLNVDAARSGLSENYYSYKGADRRLEVMKCFDKNEVVTIIGEQEVARVVHNLNFNPVQIFQNIYIPGELRGHSDIEQSVGLNEHINFMANAYEEYVLQDIYSPIVVIDPQKAPEDINPLNPNEVIPVAAGGDVKRLPSGRGVDIVDRESARTQAWIEHNTGDPRVRTEGRMSSSITTGRGIEKAQGPHFGRIEYRHDILGFNLEKVNEKYTLMTQALFPNEKINMFGRKGKHGGTFKFSIQGNELDNYGFTNVLYSPSMHMGLSERAVFVLQLLGSEYPLIDDRAAIEFLGITDHPDEMLKRIEAMVQRNLDKKIAMEKSLTGSMEGGGGPPSPLADTTKTEMQTRARLEGGGTPGSSSASSQLTTRTEGGAAATGSAGAAAPSATGDVGGAQPIDFQNPPEAPSAAIGSGLGESEMAQISSIIAQVKVTGDVYAVTGPSGKVTAILCENYVDARKISRKLKRFFPSIDVRKAGAKLPANVVTVATGSSGPATEAPGAEFASP